MQLDAIETPFQVVLVSPQIPPNTGNVGRTCAVTGSKLHLVGPLGFSLDDSKMKRAGLDYWEALAPQIYESWPDFEARALRGERGRLHLFTARADRTLYDAELRAGDFLVFGQEQLGLPPALLEAYPDRTVAIPMQPGMRSLNLSVSAGVALYEGLRQAWGRQKIGAR